MDIQWYLIHIQVHFDQPQSIADKLAVLVLTLPNSYLIRWVHITKTSNSNSTVKDFTYVKNWSSVEQIIHQIATSLHCNRITYCIVEFRYTISCKVGSALCCYLWPYGLLTYVWKVMSRNIYHPRNTNLRTRLYDPHICLAINLNRNRAKLAYINFLASAL